jgi:hypothetical protein
MLEPSSVNCVIYHGNCTDGFGLLIQPGNC